jgi:hypothetical protein
MSRVDGKTKTRKNIVKIRGTKGTKTVEITEGKKIKKSTHKLKPSEIRKIQRNQFIPGLFKPCLKCLAPRMTRRMIRRR